MLSKQLIFVVLLIYSFTSLPMSSDPSKNSLNNVEVILGTAFGTVVTALFGYLYSGSVEEKEEFLRKRNIKNPNSDVEWKEKTRGWGAWQYHKEFYNEQKKAF